MHINKSMVTQTSDETTNGSFHLHSRYLPSSSSSSFTFCTKDCSSKFRSKHSTILVLCLLRKLLEQSLESRKYQITNMTFFQKTLSNN